MAGLVPRGCGLRLCLDWGEQGEGDTVSVLRGLKEQHTVGDGRSPGENAERPNVGNTSGGAAVGLRLQAEPQRGGAKEGGLVLFFFFFFF